MGGGQVKPLKWNMPCPAYSFLFLHYIAASERGHHFEFLNIKIIADRETETLRHQKLEVLVDKGSEATCEAQIKTPCRGQGSRRVGQRRHLGTT